MKCVICDGDVDYVIKGTHEGYCKECALEHFEDVDMLEPRGNANAKEDDSE